MICRAQGAVGLYARVSSDQQMEARTIESQVEALEARACEDGCEVKGDLKFIDDGYSGSTLCRPSMDHTGCGN